jgi:phosphodiesterase/alkaline phosphatase D-like protein
VAEDTTYKSAFIFLGRTVSDLNDASIRIDGLRNHTDYYYRIFLGTEMSSISGTFNTGDPPKK